MSITENTDEFILNHSGIWYDLKIAKAIESKIQSMPTTNLSLKFRWRDRSGRNVYFTK